MTFIVSVDHSEYFLVQPAIDAVSGALTFTPVPNIHPQQPATITVRLKDDGGTADHGLDESAPRTFTVSITKSKPRHNANQPLDVDANGRITPHDTQLIITYLNQFGARPVLQGDYGPPYWDVTNDNFIAPNDVVALISYLNGHFQAPSFSTGPDQSTTDESSVQTVTGFATNMSDGTLAGLSLQRRFQVTTDHPEYFRVQPAIDSTTGTLTYTPKPNAHGTATVTVTLNIDEEDAVSQAQTFTITVAKPHPRRNTDDRYDVNGDGLITSSDTQRIIAELNAHGSHSISASDYGPNYYDVNGDGQISPSDMTAAISYINGYLDGVGGIVYVDGNNGGIHQSDESGIEGVLIHLVGVDGNNQAFNVTTTTDASGQFLFPIYWTSNGIDYDLTNGNFRIVINPQDEPAGYSNGTDRTDDWILNNNGDSTPYAFLDPQAVDACIVQDFTKLAGSSSGYNEGQLVSFAKRRQ